MLQYETAWELFQEIRRKRDALRDEDIDELYRDFLKLADEYGRTRLSWAFMTTEEKRQDDASRTIRHDAFMARFRSVCRALNIEGIDELMPNRKLMGDFACYVCAFLAIEQR